MEALRCHARSAPLDPVDAIWEKPDPLWARSELILLADAPPARTGRPRGDWRQILNGFIFQMLSGFQQNKLPKEFGDDSTVHRWFQRWCCNRPRQRIWAELVADCDELQGVNWDWQSTDGSLGKALLGGPDRAEPHRSRQERHQAECDGRRAWCPLWNSDCWGKSARLYVARADD